MICATTRLTSHLVVLVLLVYPMAGHAQRWTPVIVETTDGEGMVTMVRRLSSLMPPESQPERPLQAARRFEETHSAEPALLQKDLIRELETDLSQAIEEAALNGWNDKWLIRFKALSVREQDYALQHSSTLARDLFLYCAMPAEAMLRVGRTSSARDTMAACIHQFPAQRLPTVADKALVTLYEQVHSELSSGDVATLSVDVSSPAANAGAGCETIANGIPLGPLPHTHRGLPPVEIRIQINCGGQGRVHTLKLKAGDNRLVIDQRFQAALRTREHLGLAYATPQAALDHQMPDAIRIGRILESSRVLLVSSPDPNRILFALVDTKRAETLGQAAISKRASDEDLREAILALVHGESVEIDAPTAPMASQTAPTPYRGRALYAGTALAVGSAVGYALAWVMYVQRVDARNAFAADLASMGSGDAPQQRYEDLGVFTPILGLTGALLGAAALPALLPADDGVPLWSWMVGIGGLALVGTGAALWAQSEACTISNCNADALDPSLGQLLLLQGVPLLSVPITHGVRALLGTEQLTVTAQVGTTAGRLTMEAPF